MENIKCNKCITSTEEKDRLLCNDCYSKCIQIGRYNYLNKIKPNWNYCRLCNKYNMLDYGVCDMCQCFCNNKYKKAYGL